MDQATIEATARAVVAALPKGVGPGERGMEPMTTAAEGDIVWIYSRGQYRRGVVVKVTPTRAEVRYTTASAIEESAKIHAIIRGTSEADTAASAERQARRNWKFYAEMADGTCSTYRRFASVYTPERKAKEMADYAARMAEHGNQVATYVRSCVEAALTALAQRKAESPDHLAHITYTTKAARITDLFRNA
ncbi:hypothetical protein ACFY05_31915 [Microtetraspora fusca]|uniref:Uncharacterized protein n=1 Tax=Microtetraspora fusca TaxID=1997 RepID=A0ABW6VH94_MICFU